MKVTALRSSQKETVLILLKKLIKCYNCVGLRWLIASKLNTRSVPRFLFLLPAVAIFYRAYSLYMLLIVYRHWQRNPPSLLI